MAEPARKLSLLARGTPLASSEKQLETLAALELATEFEQALEQNGLWPLCALRVDTLQINLGKLCNQVCRHCHVDAGPDRREVMSRETFEQCLAALDNSGVSAVDLTGGAPELNPNFRWFVGEVRARDRHVIDRCNLTIIEANKHRDLPEFFAEHQVEVVSSLPHYRPFNTDRQRGEGVFEKSIRALRRLNEVGYGRTGTGLRLVLVTNPVGAFLPPSQTSLEAEWKREMERLHGVQFDALFTITNMPIARYLEWLVETANLESYMQKLLDRFNPGAAAGVMCRTHISVGWDGRLYDCDFNQMLELGLNSGSPTHIRGFDRDALAMRTIRVARHCFGCTAGSGSSCGGAVDEG